MMALTPMPVLAAKNLGKPVVWYAHDYWAMCALRNFIDPYNAMNRRLCGKPDGKTCNQCRINIITSIRLLFWKMILNKADIAISTGKRMIEIYEREGILKGKWNIVTPWLDPFMLEGKGTKKRNKKILFVGSLIDYKGAWVAVKALKHVLKKIPKARLVLIGDEQHSIFRKRMDLIAKKENVSSNVIFAGKRDKKYIKKMLNQGGVFACPTVCMESFGLNWAEAMASGCPVVASAIGSIPEHVDGKSGLLFTPRNYEQLASGIVKVLGNPNLAKRLSKNGKLHAKKNFDIEINGKKIISLYNKILKSQ